MATSHVRSATIVSGTVTTSTDAAAKPIGNQAGACFSDVILYNPAGSAGGQWSDDNFGAHVFDFPAGPVALHLLRSASLVNGLSVRRLAGQSNVSGAVVLAF